MNSVLANSTVFRVNRLWESDLQSRRGFESHRCHHLWERNGEPHRDTSVPSGSCIPNVYVSASPSPVLMRVQPCAVQSVIGPATG